MERVRARQVAGNAPWEMKSFLPPAMCLQRAKHKDKLGETGREWEGGVCHESRAEQGNVFLLLQLYINTLFPFRDQANRHLN